MYLPAEYPQLTDELLEEWRQILAKGNTAERTAYAALAAEILKLFVDDIPAEDLEAIAARAYTTEKFSSEDIVPLTTLEDGIFLGHLSEANRSFQRHGDAAVGRAL